MTDHRQRLTTEDFAERTPGDRGFADRDAVDQTPADRDVAEPNLTDQERLDREPSTYEHVYDTPQSDAQHGDAQHGDVQHGDTQHAGVQQVNRSDSDEPAAWDDRSVAQPHDETVAQDPQHRAGHDQDGQDRDGHDQDGQVGLRPDEPVELSAASVTPGDAPLFTEDDAADYQANWRALQADFVDDPREAVQRADELVAQVMQSLATTFAEHKHSLEEQWQQGDEVQTEELRQALKRYRSFFDRLLRV